MPLLATNAPDHWPDFEMTDPLEQSVGQATVQVANVMRDRLGSVEGLDLASVMHFGMEEDGLLLYPIVMNDQGKPVPVFIYPTADANAGAHFAAVEALLAASNRPKPIYYAPSAMPSVEAAQTPLVPFLPESLKRLQAPEPGHYAMWWQTPDEPPFVESETAKALERVYAAFDGYQTCFTGLLMRPHGVVDGGGRVKLPEQAVHVPVLGPDGMRMVLAANRERGIHVLFRAESTPPIARDRFWSIFASFAELGREQLERQNVPLDEEDQRGPKGWWTSVMDAARSAGTTGTAPQAIGLLKVDATPPGAGGPAAAGGTPPAGQ